ncbi:hypothetical protein RUND412_007442 [Rhizina undulata]
MSSVPTVVEETPTPPAPKKVPRTKTSYHLAQPPPASHHLHIPSLKPSRSLVLQLQRLTNSARPLPTFDVLPASVFAPNVKRHFAKFFKYEIGMQDLVFLSSEAYDGEESDAGSDGESLNSRHVASVCHGSRKIDGEVQKVTVIRFRNGQLWEVTPISTGGYEFVAQDENGELSIARWIPKNPNMRRRSHQTRPHVEPEDRKFQFSLVNPNSRKHPIIATMGKQQIDILDKHTATFISSSPVTNTQRLSATSSRQASPVPSPTSDGETERPLVKTDDKLRTLILVTGIWVALREGLAYNSLRTEEPSSPSPISPSSTYLGPNNPLGRSCVTSRSFSDHNMASNSNRNGQNEGGAGADSTPRRAVSMGGLPRQHRSNTVGSRLSRRSVGNGSNSPVSERSANNSRAATPENFSRALPPDDTPSPGCISRRFVSHRISGAGGNVSGAPPRQAEAERGQTPTADAEAALKREEAARKMCGKIKSIFTFGRKTAH